MLDSNVNLAKLKQENDKLKYRVGILERSLQDQLTKSKKGNPATVKKQKTGDTPVALPVVNQTNDVDPSGCILASVKELFNVAIRTAYPELQNSTATVTPATQEKFGDYQCNSPMALCQVLTLLNLRVSIFESLSIMSLLSDIRKRREG